MAQIENEGVVFNVKINAIELLKYSIELPSVENVSLSNFNFGITIQNKADFSKKLLFSVIAVEVKNDDQRFLLGSLMASCIYEIPNFETVISKKSDGDLDIPGQLLEVLNSISISTTRGLMFSNFKGTFLHNAFLPIVDPKKFEEIVGV